MTIRIAIIGFGKIARDQHVPTIAADPRFELVAISTRSGDPGIGVPCYADVQELVRSLPEKVDAVAICTPPGPRYAVARAALEAGLAVLLEKPPAATLGEIYDFERIARQATRALYAGWHSQHAAGVEGARAALTGERIASLRISWFEDVRKWHPGQDWVWEPSGFGVFDPGINALSIATRILPAPLFVKEARLLVPANRQAPIAASLTFVGDEMTAEFDWRHSEDEEWTIEVRAVSGRTVELRGGGAHLLIDGHEQAVSDRTEYAGIYDRFAQLIEQRAVDVDSDPLRIVADAFLVARREQVEAFQWTGN